MHAPICPECGSSDISYRFSTREYECHNCRHVFSAPYDETVMNKMSAQTAQKVAEQSREKAAENERRYALARSTGRCPTCKGELREFAGGSFYCEKCDKVIASAAFDPSEPLGAPSSSEDNTSHQYERYYEGRIDRGKEP